MPLTIGARLGIYEIVSELGAGGMGQVYRARDTKLGRDVAIKIISDGFGHDSERLARFQREAHLLAVLNHPHIAAIYGFEEANGTQFLVLELVEGATLADRLKTGRLSVSEALSIARQIAEALEAAHEKGIVHRDLKPANVKITADGTVKVLDFGLAKAMEPIGAGLQTGGASDLTHSPTLSIVATQAGIILGTAAFMSPEQAKGLPADQRSDVFSFGSLLYEMLTGRQAFQGDTSQDILASVLVREPDLAALPPNLNPRLRELLQRCFEKNPKRRWQAVGDLRAEIEAIAASPHGSTTTMMAAAPQPLWRRLATQTAMWLLGAVIAGTAVWISRGSLPPPRVSRLLITPPSAAALTINTALGHDVAITPDGTRIVYTGANGTLFVRPLDRLDATPLAGLDNPGDLFASPDGQWIGFSDGTRSLKKIAITGGPAVTLVQLNALLAGASWAADDTIVFATRNPATGLQRISAAGGEPTMLTRPDHARGEGEHLYPDILPGGRAVLFTITATGGLDQAQIAVLDLQTGTQTTLIRGGNDARYVSSRVPNAAIAPGNPSGYLVYGAAGTLRAIGFDLARLAVVGTPVPIVPQVVTTNIGAVDVAAAGDGTLVYVPGVGTGQRMLVWVDRQGQEVPIDAPTRAYAHSRISPDGTRVAFALTDQEPGIWVWDWIHSAFTRLTFDPAGDNTYPVWTPDGHRLLFSFNPPGQLTVVAKAADGTGAVTQLIPNGGSPTSISPDGTRLVFTQNTDPKTGPNVMQLQLGGTHQITPLVQTQFAERNGVVSPDGRWLAYEANDSGLFEIYVRPFPDVLMGRWQVSTGGGRQPLWARSGQELFYLGTTGTLMRVGVARGAAWAATAPTKLFEAGRYYNGTAGQVGRNYDIAPDGQRFLMIKPAGDSAPAPAQTSLVVVQHFDEELKRLVSAK